MKSFRMIVASLSVVILLGAAVSAQTTWTGTLSTNWNHSGNWDTSVVPGSGDDVIIPSGPVNQPSGFLLNPTCNDLDIQAGASLTLGGGFDLTINGNLTLDGTLSVTAATSGVTALGDWMNNGTFTNGGGVVDLLGTGMLGGSSSTDFGNLSIGGATRTIATGFTVSGDVSVAPGTAIDLGSALTHSVAGNWTSSAGGISVSGSSTVDFTGNGLLTTGGNTIPNMSVSGGTRLVNESSVAGDLSVSGGELRILDNATLAVAGDASILSGTLSWESLFAGDETLAVSGGVTITAAAGSTSPTARLSCGGNWSSTSAFAPSAGLIVIDGGGTTTIGGASPTFADLRIADGDRSAVSALVVTGDLTVDSGAALTSSASMDVAGSFTIGDGTASWDMGASTHTVGGGYVSSGAVATGAGTLELDGSGSLGTGGGSVSNVVVSAGTIAVADLVVTGNLDMTGGSFDLGDDRTVTVGGNMTFSAGTLNMFSSGLATPLEVIDVAGDVSLAAAAGTLTDNSWIYCGGNWSSTGAWLPPRGMVALDGAGGNTLGGTGVTFYGLIIGAGTKTLTDAALVQATLNVADGASLVSGAAIDVDGGVTLGDGTANWDLGAFTHTVAGNLASSGASATGAGTIEFDGSGTTTTMAATLANVLVSSGTRNLATTTIAGDLDMTGGEIVILNDADVAVGGNATLGAGTLTFDSGSPGTQVLDVEGDMTLTAAAGTAGADSLIRCAGNWSSSAAWASADGTVELDGGTSTTVSGATPTFFDLHVVSGTKNVTSASVLAGSMTVDSGATLDTDAALDVAGNVTLGDITASWDLGTDTHTVAGDYASSGADAIGAGAIEFDGTGTLGTGGGSISNMTSSAGTRSVSDTTVTGDLALTGGTLSLANDQTLAVNGNADFSGGTLDFPTVADAVLDVISVDGDVSVTASAGTTHANSRLICGGNWTSTPAFAPSAGRVVLNAAGPATISGAGGVTLAQLQLENSSKTLSTTSLTVSQLDILTGTAFVSSAGTVDVNGSVSLADASSSWDLGALTHSVSGNWISSGGSTLGAGTISFDGAGTVATGGGTISNMASIAGTRQVADSEITGNVSLTLGTLRVLGDQTLTVGGNASFTGGLLAWNSVSNGSPDIIDVAGNVTVTSLAGSNSTDSRLYCGGNWTSTSAFNPAAGRVILDGAGATTISGAGGISLAELQLAAGTKTLLNGLSVDSLDILDGTTFVTNAVVNVAGDVTLGASSASWALGVFAHSVANDWTSGGASATGLGQIHFTGSGTLDTGGGSISRITSSAGTRTVNTSEVTGNATVTGGQLVISADQALTVGGNLALSGGTVSWDPVADATPEVIDVAGNVNVQASVGTESTSSRLYCAGDWTSDGSFSPTSVRVELDGGTAATVDASPTEGAAAVLFGDLAVVSGAKTLLADADVVGELSVDAGASLTLAAQIAANDVVIEGTLALDTHTIACATTWTSDAGGAAVTGTGLVEFTGSGTVTTGSNSIPNMLVSGGTRGVYSSAIADALDMTGGQLLMLDDQVLSVAGSATLSGGQLAFLDLTSGFERLDVAGDVFVSASAGSTNSNSRIECGGNWSSTAAFAPANGTVVLDGVGATTLGGAGMTLADLSLTAGTKTVTTAFTARDVTLGNNVNWDFTGGGALTATDDVMLGNATATLNLGGLTHNVTGDWISIGANATNGTVSFTGGGLLSTGAATIDNVVVSGGARSVSNSSIAGNLALNAGVLLILNDQTLGVAGNATLTGGTLAFDPVPAGTNEVLDVAGDVFCTSSAGFSANTAIVRCAGEWSSNSAFAPTALTVELDGAGTTGINAVGPGFDPTFDKLVIRNGTRQPTSDFAIAATSIEIAPTGTLDLDGRTLTDTTAPITVNGMLSIDAGAALALGGNAVTVSPSGTLSVIGSVSSPARVTGAGGGGWFMTVDGMLAARQFRFEQMGLSGLGISSAATIAPFPDDLRAGVFSMPSATPGSVMLDIQRAAPTTFRYVDFEDPGTVGTNNVRTLSGSGAVVSFINSDGDFSGSGFELDPFNKIAWPTDDVTTLAAATATAGPDMVTLDWTSTKEVDIDKYVLQRSTSFGGPFADLVEVAPTGPGAYNFVDATVTPKQLYYYRLNQRRTDDGIDLLASVQANPWSAAPPANFFTVGGSGVYPDIQTALNAITSEVFPVVSIEAGTYPAFTVNPAGFGTLRILADGSGPVIIDTTTQPLQIENFGIATSLEMSDFIIGDVGSPNPAVTVTNCAGTIVLDELVVQGGAGFGGFVVDNSTRVSIQRCTTAGDDGLMLTSASKAIVLGGSLDDIDLKDGSDARLGGLTTSSTVEAGSALTTFAGVQSDIDAPEMVSIGSPFIVTLTGEPGGTWAIIYSFGMGWLDLTGPSWEMVGLADFTYGDILTTGPMGSGVINLPGALPATGIVFGQPIALQIVCIHPTTGKRRWSNVTSIIGVN